MADERDLRIEQLEQEVAHLRRLLNARGEPSTLRHQVRASLALMKAILRRSADQSTAVEDYAALVEARFDALSRVQSQLIAALDTGVDLHRLISDELVAHVIHEGERATLAGPVLGLGPKTAQLLALTFHELVVHALDVGLTAGSPGRLDVVWSISDDVEPILTLDWSEREMTPPLRASAFGGFGIETLQAMLRYELNAQSQLDLLPSGMRCIIKLPLAQSRR